MTDPSATQRKAGLTKLGLRLFQGILPFDRSRVLADIIAGLTLAAVGIPEVMGYTKIIDTPVITGPEKTTRLSSLSTRDALGHQRSEFCSES